MRLAKITVYNVHFNRTFSSPEISGNQLFQRVNFTGEPEPVLSELPNFTTPNDRTSVIDDQNEQQHGSKKGQCPLTFDCVDNMPGISSTQRFAHSLVVTRRFVPRRFVSRCIVPRCIVRHSAVAGQAGLRLPISTEDMARCPPVKHRRCCRLYSEVVVVDCKKSKMAFTAFLSHF